jgi:hypothetical protein
MVEVAMRVGVPQLTEDLHVLLRHRLLLEPGGFEGFVSVEVLLAAHNSAIPDSEEDRQVPVGRCAARPAPSAKARPRKDAVVANLDVFLDIDVQPIKALDPLLQVALVGLPPPMGCSVGVFRRRLPFDLWVKEPT